MPEGDTVWRAARSLDRALAGQVLTASDFRVPQLATVDLTGGIVRQTLSRGKHLLTHIDTDQSWTLHTHLKMEGTWQIYQHSQRWRRPAHQARVVLATSERVAVGFSLGIVELMPRHQEQDAVGHLGPDLLGPDWDEEEAVRRLLAAPDRGVHEALLDQSCLAGIGNMYAAELCFTSGVHPLSPIGEVEDPLRLVRRAHQMLDAEQGPRGPEHDRRPARAGEVLGLPARRPRVPSVRHTRAGHDGGPGGPASARRTGARPASRRDLETYAAEATTSAPRRREVTVIGVAAAMVAASSTATASETSRSTADSGRSSAVHREESSSEDASFWPRSISEM